jgi:outer membrane protein assembly factor BamB
VHGDRVYVTAAQDRGERRLVHCLHRNTGQLLWSRALADRDPERTSALTGHAASTPATDGRYVVAFFGNAGVVCYDTAGRQRWHRSLGTFDTELGLASSPVLDGSRVYLVCDHDGDRFTSFDSFLVALDRETGQERWRVSRPGHGRSWSTPILVPGPDGRRQLIVSGEERLRAYDPETGKALWQAAGLTGWVAPSPVFGHGLIFAASDRDGPILAVAPGGTGDVPPRWRLPRGGPYVTSPVLLGDHLYTITELGIVSCHAATTGERLYRERLAGKFTASPVAGDGKVIVVNEAGTAYVLAAGPRFAVLARNRLGEECLASPAVADGLLFLRTAEHVYCFGPPP